MHKIKPLVSVITPCYNGAKFLVRAVESVKNQHFNIEHFIIDDCSTDNSWNILLDLSNKYDWIKPIRLEKNSGPVIARNIGINSAQGKFLAFLDVDDYWLPCKLNLQINFMEQTQAAISFTDCRFISEDGRLIGRRFSGFNRIGIRLHYMTRFIPCLTVIINREKCKDFYIPPIQPSERAEDFIAWLKVIEETGPALRCPFDLARYSVVINSRSSAKFKSSLSVWYLYKKGIGLPLLIAVIYFFSYVIFSLYKKVYYRPQFVNLEIDLEFSKK